jgi:hypothetical protein
MTPEALPHRCREHVLHTAIAALDLVAAMARRNLKKTPAIVTLESERPYISLRSGLQLPDRCL